MKRVCSCADARRLALFAICAALPIMMAGNAHSADKIIFVTDYGLYGRHAYYFVALEKGYYARESIEIEIVRSQGSANTIKQVANATAQIGFADAFAVVLGRANDDIPVKLVAMIYPSRRTRFTCSRSPGSRSQRTSRARLWLIRHSAQYLSFLRLMPERRVSMPAK